MVLTTPAKTGRRLDDRERSNGAIFTVTVSGKQSLVTGRAAN